MKEVFTQKRKALLMKGAISFVILSILAVAYLSSSLGALAKPLVPNDTIEGRFQAFCDFYYNDEPADEQAVDVPSCEAITDSFVSIIPSNLQSQWPDKSIKVLAIDGISSASDLEQVLRDAVGDPSQQVLIDDDPAFIPTLFEFETSDLDS